MSHLINAIRGLDEHNHRITSPEDENYNCLAWAIGDKHNNWWPVEGHYWPEGLPRKQSVECFDALFESLGFEFSTHGDLERGYTKVAMYTDFAGRPQHFARQLEDGRWASKLGRLEDIEHDLDAIVEHYGRATRFWRRPVD